LSPKSVCNLCSRSNNIWYLPSFPIADN